MSIDCPQCDWPHVAPALPGEGRLLLGCVRCGHHWPAGEIARGGQPVTCREHPERPGRARCRHCERACCESCLTSTKTTRCCDATALPFAEVLVIQPFWRELPQRLLWPLRPSGLFLLLLCWVLGFVPFVSWLVLIFLAAYLQQLLRESARGATDPPAYPEFDSLVVDLLYPWLRFIAVVVACWAPQYLLREPGRLSDALAVVGLLVAPLGLMAVSVSRSSHTLLRPLRLFDVLRRILWPDYALLIAALALGVAALRLGPSLGLFEGLLGYYLLFLAFHLMGRSVFQTRDRVDWGI